MPQSYLGEARAALDNASRSLVPDTPEELFRDTSEPPPGPSIPVAFRVIAAVLAIAIAAAIVLAVVR